MKMRWSSKEQTPESEGKKASPGGTQPRAMDATQRLAEYFDLEPPTSRTATDDVYDDTEEGFDDDEQLPGAHRISSLVARAPSTEEEDEEDHTISYDASDNLRDQLNENTSNTTGTAQDSRVIELERRVEELEIIRLEENVVEAHVVETNEQQPEVRADQTSINVGNVVMVADFVEQQHPSSKQMIVLVSGTIILLVVAIVTVAWVGMKSQAPTPTLPTNVAPTNETMAPSEFDDRNATRVQYVKSESVGGIGGLFFDDTTVLPVSDRIEYVTNVTLYSLWGSLESITLEVMTEDGTLLTLGSTLVSGPFGYSGWPTTLLMNQEKNDTFTNITLQVNTNTNSRNYTFEGEQATAMHNATEYETIDSMYVETGTLKLDLGGKISEASIVRYLKLTTSMGRSVEAGTLEASGNGTTFAIDKHQIVGFYGRVGTIMDRAGAIFMANE